MNHRKLPAYADNDLFALWTRLGLLAIERFADRTGDTFILHQAELPALAGVRQFRKSLKVLQKLCECSPIVYEFSDGVFRIHFPNFAKKQGFGKRNGRETGDTPTATPTATSKEKESRAGARAQSTAGEGKKPPKRKRPEPPPEALRLASLWAEMRASTIGTPKPVSLAVWADDLRKLLMLDKRDEAELESVIRWLYGPNLEREAFQFQCHSPKALRRDGCERLDRIVGTMSHNGGARRSSRDSSYVAPFASPNFRP